ncbi:MAG: PorT family protein [Tannerellaceae bacterium]|jgi:hypothetical protein|nr:PorT family protein [Tannerellaceae bacterium]
MKTKSQTNRIVLMAIVAIAAVSNVWAQTMPTAPTEEVLVDRWGIKGGINIATVSFENANNAVLESVVGAAAGVTLEHPFNANWFFHSGLEFSMKGFELGSGSSTTLTATAIYLLLPASVGYKFNIGKGWKLEPRLGLYLAYGVAGDTSLSSSGDSGSVSTFGDEIFKPLDYGTMGGFFFDNNQVVIGLHSEIGMSEVNGNSFKVTGTKAHNSNVSITVGYLF